MTRGDAALRWRLLTRAERSEVIKFLAKDAGIFARLAKAPGVPAPAAQAYRESARTTRIAIRVLREAARR